MQAEKFDTSFVHLLCKVQQNFKINAKGINSNWRAQSKNDPLIFRPFLKVSTCQNSTTSEHFQKWPKNQGIVLALSLSLLTKLVSIGISNVINTSISRIIYDTTHMRGEVPVTHQWKHILRDI